MENVKWLVTINDIENVVYKTIEDVFDCLPNEVENDNGVNEVIIKKISMSDSDYEELSNIDDEH